MNGLMLSLHYDLSLCALTVVIYPWSLELIKVSNYCQESQSSIFTWAL